MVFPFWGTPDTVYMYHVKMLDVTHMEVKACVADINNTVTYRKQRRVHTTKRQLE